MAPENVIDELRYAYAQAASHGCGAGQVEARGLVAAWEPEEGRRLAAQVLDNLDLAQAYAQSASTHFEDYAAQLAASEYATEKSELSHQDTLMTVYRAGFDIGFRAALVEGCTTLREQPVTE
jgi:hypothetical protein